MYNRKQNILAAALLMACAGSAFAAPPSLDLKLTGTIIPGSCTASFSGEGGNVSYGSIKSEDIQEKPTLGHAYNLPTKHMAINVQCDNPKGVAISFHDQRPGTIYLALHDFGFSYHNGKPVGGYGIRHDVKAGASGNESSAPVLSNNTVSGTWNTLNTTSGLDTLVKPNMFYTLGSGGSDKPVSYKTYTFPFVIEGALHGKNFLDLSSQIEIDGFTTIQLTYI